MPEETLPEEATLDAEAGTVEAGEAASTVAKAPWELNGLAQGEDGVWYAFRDGIVDTSVDDTLMPYGGGWWYIGNEGIVDFSYNGYGRNMYGDWKVKNGAVDFEFTGTCKIENEKERIYMNLGA